MTPALEFHWRSVSHPLIWSATVAIAMVAAPVPAADVQIARGRSLAHDVYKGNCLACHQIPGDATALSLADIGPPLVALRERFPDRAMLRRQIWDPAVRNPETVMPPFGEHKILTEQEIDLIIDYLYQY